MLVYRVFHLVRGVPQSRAHRGLVRDPCGSFGEDQLVAVVPDEDAEPTATVVRVEDPCLVATPLGFVDECLREQ